MSVWTTRNPWGADDDFGFPWDSPRERAKSLEGRTLLRNFGPRPLETEDDRIAMAHRDMARLIREAQQKMFRDRIMREAVDIEERVTGEQPAQPVEVDMDSRQVFSMPPPSVNGTWRYDDIATLGPPGRSPDNGGMDS